MAQLRDHDTTANTLHSGHTAVGQGHNMGSIFETEFFNASGHLGDASIRDCGPFDGDTSRDYELAGGSIFPSGGCSTAPQIGTQDMTICQRLESPTAGNACEPELSGQTAAAAADGQRVEGTRSPSVASVPEPGDAPIQAASDGTLRIGISRSKRKALLPQTANEPLPNRRQQHNNGFYKDLHCGT